MNITMILGKIKNTPEIIRNEDGQEEAIFFVEIERNYKNTDGEILKDVVECRIANVGENFKEIFTEGTNVAIQGKVNTQKKSIGENQFDSLYVDIKKVASLSNNQNSSTVSIVGYVANDLELRETANGKKVVNVAVGITKENKNEEPVYIRAAIWDKMAENITKYCRKGDLICLKGVLRTNNIENDKNIKTDLMVEKVVFVNTKKREIPKDEEKEQDLV